MADKFYDAYSQEIELTKEQQACLKYTGDKTLMVKGYAGSGKSLVLMVIADKFLKKYGTAASNKVALFTFQNTLVATTKEFLKVNGHDGDGVLIKTVNSYVKYIYDWLVLHKLAPKRRFPYKGKNAEEQHLNNIKHALSAHRTRYGKHRFHDLDFEFWSEEFEWMKQMNVWTNDLDYYLTLPRRGRGGQVRMSTQDRVTAYQIFSYYCKYLDDTGQGDWEDQTLYLVRHPDLIPQEMKYEHILIDEAQDLSLAQMLAIWRLCRSSMVVAMDMNQKIHSRYWTPKLLGIESTTKKLTKSMRTTRQIEALAESLRSKNDANLDEDDKSLRAIPERSEKVPQIVCLENQAAERKYVVNLVQIYRKANSKLTIGIIAAMNKQIRIYSDWLTSAGIPHEQITKDSTFSMAKPGVKVVSAYGAKGLEFDCVIIPMFANGYFPYNTPKRMRDDPEASLEFLIKQRNLAYVSMTRAKHLLTITFWGNGGSRFIDEMDPALYEWEGVPRKTTTSGNKFRPYSQGNVRTGEKMSSPEADISQPMRLVDYLKKEGLEVFDKRPMKGALWVVGDKRIDPIIQETRKKFGAFWIYKETGGNTTNHRPSWYTSCPK